MDIGSVRRVAPPGDIKVTSGQSAIVQDLAANGSPCHCPCCRCCHQVVIECNGPKASMSQHAKQRCHSRGHVLRGRDGVVGL
jgi:hypothetical protein